MDPGDILALRRGLLHMADDLVQGQRRGVDDPRLGCRMGDHRRRHQGAGIEHQGTAGDQIPAAEGQQLGIARPRADEIDGHAAPSSPLPAFFPA